MLHTYMYMYFQYVYVFVCVCVLFYILTKNTDNNCTALNYALFAVALLRLKISFKNSLRKIKITFCDYYKQKRCSYMPLQCSSSMLNYKKYYLYY